MIEVWIRHADNPEAIRLCEWDASDLDSLLPSIGRWGVNAEGDEYLTDALSGRIVVDDERHLAYFEVLIGLD